MADEDPKYVQFVRELLCCACLGPAPCHPHHSKSAVDDQGRRHGKGQRAHDHDSMPLHFQCHRDFHDGAGHFDGWTKHQRRVFERDNAAATWALWVTTSAGKDAERYAAAPATGPEALFDELVVFGRKLPRPYAFELEQIVARHRDEEF